MQLHQVRYFVAVAEHGGLSSAAATLEVAQSTLSQAVRELERELDAQLFYRIGRGMVPTPAGRAFLGSSRVLLRGVTAASGAVSGRGEIHGSLMIRVHATLAAVALTDWLVGYRRQHPGVRVRVEDLSEEDSLTTQISEGQCDMAISHLPIAVDGALTVIELGSHEYWAAYPVGTDLPPADPLDFHNMPDLPLVAVPKDSLHVARFEAAIASGRELRPPAAIVHDRDVRSLFVEAGVGASFLDEAAAVRARRNGVIVRRTTPAIDLRYGIVFDHTALSPAAAAFIRGSRV